MCHDLWYNSNNGIDGCRTVKREKATRQRCLYISDNCSLIGISDESTVTPGNKDIVLQERNFVNALCQVVIKAGAQNNKYHVPIIPNERTAVSERA